MELFKIKKPFVELNLSPMPKGLKISYQPTINQKNTSRGDKFCEFLIPMNQVGQLWASVKTLIQSNELVKLQFPVLTASPSQQLKFRFFSEQNINSPFELQNWLQIIDSPEARRLRKIQLGIENLHSLELACKTTIAMAVGQLSTTPHGLQKIRLTKQQTAGC